MTEPDIFLPPLDGKHAFCLIPLDEINRIRKVMKRLYTEVRMDGDIMRDNAQALDRACAESFSLKGYKITITPVEGE